MSSREKHQPQPPATAEQIDMWIDDATAGGELTRATPPQHTGEVVSRDWERVCEVLQAYAAGEPIRSICRRWHIGHNTLSRLIEAHPDLVDTERQRISCKLGRVARMMVDRLELEHHTIPIGQLPVALAIVVDKKAMLDGDPTQRVEVTQRREVTADEVEAGLQRLRATSIDVQGQPASDSTDQADPPAHDTPMDYPVDYGTDHDQPSH